MVPQSLARVIVHAIFSTKEREASIRADVRPKLEAYLGGILKHLDCFPMAVGTVNDHVHLLFVLSRKHTIADVVKELKRSSSVWMKTGEAACDRFQWQAGYGAFSVSESSRENVVTYIREQEAHHRKTTFMEEFRAFLKRHRLEFDERYVWE